MKALPFHLVELDQKAFNRNTQVQPDLIMKPLQTDNDVDKHFDTVKKICKTLLPLSDRAKRRILAYFMDAINEQVDMDRERNIIMTVARELNIKGMD